jgi:hypothetical protein
MMGFFPTRWELYTYTWEIQAPNGNEGRIVVHRLKLVPYYEINWVGFGDRVRNKKRRRGKNPPS